MTQRKAGHEFIRELLTKTAGKRILLLTVLSLAVLLLVNGSGAARGARTQGALLILAGVAGGFLMMAAEGSERVVEAEKFVLRDEKGNAAAVLGMTPNGPSLSLYDAEGKGDWRSVWAPVDPLSSSSMRTASYNPGCIRRKTWPDSSCKEASPNSARK